MLHISKVEYTDFVDVYNNEKTWDKDETHVKIMERAENIKEYFGKDQSGKLKIETTIEEYYEYIEKFKHLNKYQTIQNNYKEKYLKYKAKYLALKKQLNQ